VDKEKEEKENNEIEEAKKEKKQEENKDKPKEDHKENKQEKTQEKPKEEIKETQPKEQIENNNENLEKNENKTMNNNSNTVKVGKTDTKTIVIICLSVFIVICLIVISVQGTTIRAYRKELVNSKRNIVTDVVQIEKYKVKVHINFIPNLLLNKYDVTLSVEGQEKTLKHGVDKDFEFDLEEGEHTLTFTDVEDSSIYTDVKIEVKENMEVGYKISCYDNSISVENLYIDRDVELAENEIKMKNDKYEYTTKNYKDVKEKLQELGFTNIVEKPVYDIVLGWTEEESVDNVTIDGSDDYKRGDVFKKDAEVVITYHLKEEDDPSKNTTSEESNNTSQNQTNNTTKQNETNTKRKYNYYTTNDKDTAPKGDKGKFAYIKKGGSYDNYCVIDYDEGYVYTFAEGNGDYYCDKIKIESGNLNDGLKLSYKDKNNAFIKSIHFKYKEVPHQLVIVDNDYHDYEYSTASLEDALSLMAKKEKKIQ